MDVMINNAQKLSAVLTHWIKPVVGHLASGQIPAIPFLGLLENKVRSSGWVNPSWSLASELAPVINNASGAILQPLIYRYVSQFPDESLPNIAHSIVDEAIRQGSVSLLEGRLLFEKEDLEELKRLLTYNLPLTEECVYHVITEPHAEESAQPTNTQNP